MTGAEAEFTRYVEARQRALVATAFLLSGDRHAAEDIVQTALARTFLAWNRIRDKRALDAYVYRAIVNEHTSMWRRGWRRLERSTALLPEGPPAGRTDDELAWDERELVRALVADLPPRQRAAIVLRYYEGLTTVETAEILGCTPGTVKSQTNRALATLRSRYVGSSALPLVEGS